LKKVAFIPARGGSKSIPLKNIKLLNGKPLIYYVAAALEESNEVDGVVVATDHDEIADTVNSFGFSKLKVYQRDPQNAEDQSSTESAILEFIEKAQLADDDLFMLVQATSPFTTSEDFDKAIEKWQNENIDSLLTCARIKRFFWSEDGEPINYDFNNRPRRQDFNGTLVENGAFYLSKVGDIVSSKNRISGNIGVYEMPEHTFLELDEPWDWTQAELLLREHSVKESVPGKIKLVLSDVDGVLTDAGMYYSENGDELKRFSTYDGKAFELLRNENIQTGIITSEDTQLNRRRAEKMKLDFQFHGEKEKLKTVNKLISNLNFQPGEVAYIGDDINDRELLSFVGLAACPANAVQSVKNIPGVIQLKTRGGSGALREFVDQHILTKK